MVLPVSKAVDRIEGLRVAWERDLEGTFAAHEPRPSLAGVDPGEHEPRVLLVASMAERVHRIAREAAERLGCADPYVLYQTPRERRHLTAQALLSERPFAIRLVGPVASALDDAGLAALIGHEFGHWLALGPRANPPAVLLEARQRGASAEVVRLCWLASEITADRFGLIAAGGELEATVRLDVAMSTFDSPRALGLKELEYLDELRKRVDSGEDRLVVGERGALTSAFRLYATWLFWRTDLHRELTGIGPGDLTLSEVDAMIKAICVERSLWPSPQNLRAPAPVQRARDKAASEGGDHLLALSQRTARSAALLGDQVRTAASTMAANLGRFLGGVDSSRARVATHPEADSEPPSDLPSELDEVDEMERRFRELEAGAARQTPAPAQTKLDDLEARFRALEEHEREGD
jgi:hypothetical protein